MGRLIDADDLIKNINEMCSGFHTQGYYTCRKDVVDMIEQTDTAYDVDNPINELVKQGIDNCYFSHRYEHPGYEENMCAGLRKMNGDGEPANCCKECKLNYLYKSEHI